MKLCDKIYTCRTRTKLSQEELAEQLGVSRQAVSRWECGDNVPEPAKLLLLARIFGVTTDWLLDDTLGEPEPAQEEPAGRTQTPDSEPNPTTQNHYYAAPGWIDSAPGLIARFLRRWGWLAGVYLMIIGLLFTGISVAVRLMLGPTFTSMKQIDAVFFDGAGGMVNRIMIVPNLILTIGVIMIVGGGVLAFVLKRMGRGKQDS